MTEVVVTEIIGAVGLIALQNPPVNAAGAALRAGLVAAIETLECDPDIRAIALYGVGRSFIAGADIKEFGKPPSEPLLPDVCNRLEASTKPSVAVLHGAALGGGLEVAISAHARVALPGVQLGFPEVTLGIIPGAGGTQRAPRLIGIPAALDLITTGRRIGPEEALSLGLIDRIETGAPREVALTQARAVLAGDLPRRVTGALSVAQDGNGLAAARAKLSNTKGVTAPLRAIDAVAASTGPMAEGLAKERAIFNDCLNTPERAGLVHAFFAERAAGKVPTGAKSRNVAHIGVIGAGTMGSGIATACLMAGFAVTVVEKDQTVLTKGQKAIGRNLDGAVKRGKVSAAARADIQLTGAADIGAIGKADLVIEAVFEEMDVKKTVLKEIEGSCPSAILATNTSYLDINEMARALNAPERLIGLHFFSPAHIMRLLEVVVADRTSPEAIATAFALAKKLRKVAVASQVGEGFIGNRIMSAYRKAADFMLLDGASVSQIDAAIRGFGFAMGPFEMADLAGLDISWAARKRLAATRDPAHRYHGDLGDALCSAGAMGRKAALGYYDYASDAPKENPKLPDMLADIRHAQKITPRPYSNDEIIARYTTAMIAEAARVLADGIAARPIDIDAVFLFGYGFPRWRGGPMFFADTLGPASLVAHLTQLQTEDRHFWATPPLLAQLVRDNRQFMHLNSEA
ncbi:MAG: 3-hydroxyacyl-CoA dehydrogenase NAD-binding domain-containing protein [Pseudomonadota bacterium]